MSTWTPFRIRLAILSAVLVFMLWAVGAYAVDHQTPVVCNHVPHSLCNPEVD